MTSLFTFDSVTLTQVGRQYSCVLRCTITFLNAIYLFYNFEEYPINLAGIFQDHIDPALQKGFSVHYYPLYGQTRKKAFFNQRSILVNMLNALIKVENNLTNIHDIFWLEQRGFKKFHFSQGHANASVPKKTL